MTSIFRLQVDVGPEWSEALVPTGSELLWTKTEFGKLVTFWSHSGEPTAPADETHLLRFDSLPLPPGADLNNTLRGVADLAGAVAYIQDGALLWVCKKPAE
ncbi:hypothetical protein [Nocardia sp. NPDC005825]|uniref:hypothetical protein n=1 Tax=unclassified Nocardia TaxID=2637762 RepID=UPI0033CA16E7